MKNRREKVAEAIINASLGDCIVPGFNVFGYEDAQAIVKAAEELQCPVLLMTNKDACKVMPIETWGAMLSSIANNAKTIVGVHLDHCTDENIINRAMNSGYDSVMFDGSQLELSENIRMTCHVTKKAHDKGILVEGEVGSVPYTDRPNEIKAELTDPTHVKTFQNESNVDWVAVSIGNVHKLLKAKVSIRFDTLEQIEAVTTIPLVLHGATGIADDEMRLLRKHRIGKVNIGTIMRYTFGNALRESVNSMPETFDRLALMKNSIQAVESKAIDLLQLLYK